jgi:hypothetical protein
MDADKLVRKEFCMQKLQQIQDEERFGVFSYILTV